MSDGTEKKRKMNHNVFRRLLLLVLGLLAGVNVYLANAHDLGGNQLPMPFGYGIANVVSGSMEPTFSKGTLLLVKAASDAEVGEIVVYQSERHLVVHRVIERNGDTVVTQGDANNVPDEPFSSTEIKGVVVGWIPYAGNLVNILKTPAGICILLLVAFLLAEGSFRRERDADDRELEAIKEEIRRLKEEREED